MSSSATGAGQQAIGIQRTATGGANRRCSQITHRGRRGLEFLGGDSRLLLRERYLLVSCIHLDQQRFQRLNILSRWRSAELRGNTRCLFPSCGLFLRLLQALNRASQCPVVRQLGNRWKPNEGLTIGMTASHGLIEPLQLLDGST